MQIDPGLHRVHEHLFGQKFKLLESNDDLDEFRGLLERLTTTLDFLFSVFVFLLKRRVHIFLTTVSSVESIGVLGLIPYR